MQQGMNQSQQRNRKCVLFWVLIGWSYPGHVMLRAQSYVLMDPFNRARSGPRLFRVLLPSFCMCHPFLQHSLICREVTRVYSKNQKSTRRAKTRMSHKQSFCISEQPQQHAWPEHVMWLDHVFQTHVLYDPLLTRDLNPLPLAVSPALFREKKERFGLGLFPAGGVDSTGELWLCRGLGLDAALSDSRAGAPLVLCVVTPDGAGCKYPSALIVLYWSGISISDASAKLMSGFLDLNVVLW